MSEGGAARRFKIRLAYFALPLALAVVAGIVLRILWLDRLPGINGDEAWYGALAQRWAAGDLAMWRTPTGNLPGPIQPALIALSLSVMPPDFALLRIPAALSSIAALALAWWIGRRHIDAATGRIALLLMATLPPNIVNARFGWDPSHSPLLVLGGIVFALEQRLLPLTATYALAVWTHPTNVFAAPLFLIVFAAAERRAGDGRLLTPRTGAAAGLIGVATAIMMATADQAGGFVDPGAMLARLVSPGDWLTFVQLLGRLMAGEPWFVAISGGSYGALLPLVDMIALPILIATTWYGVRILRRDGLTVSGSLLLGWLAMFACFALIAGSAPLNPPAERYAFVLVAPTAMAIAVVARAALGAGAGTMREALGTAAVGAALLTSTVALYMAPLARRDPETHNAFKTGPIEPKEAAARWLLTEAGRGGPVRVIAEDWWLYWPLAYRLAGEPVTLIDAETRPDEATRLVPDRTFDAVFAGSPNDRRIAAEGARPVWSANGYDGRAVVRLWERPVRP